MRIKEVVLTKPLSPAQSRLHALQSNVAAARKQLQQERDRQRQQRELKQQR
jgi:hypothetical protein